MTRERLKDMKHLNDMRIGVRLGLGFGVLLALLVAVALLALSCSTISRKSPRRTMPR